MRLALGSVQFGLPYGISNEVGQTSQNEVKEMISLANEFGIDTIDTAISYGDSEICLGKVGVKNFKVITKLPQLPSSCNDITVWVKKHISESLERLGVSQLHGLLLHRSHDLLGNNGKLLYRSLLQLKDQGIICKLGVSIYSPDELDAIYNIFILDLVQAPFNLLDQRLNTTGWIERLKSKYVEIHSRSVFLQGLLLMPRVDVPIQFSKWEVLWNKWHKWLIENNYSALQACLAFPLSFEGIDRVIVGANNSRQLIQIINASEMLPSLYTLPNLRCEDENLINPSIWPKL